jgi:LPXTG-site transpeptidase (sortase) family protein
MILVLAMSHSSPLPGASSVQAAPEFEEPVNLESGIPPSAQVFEKKTTRHSITGPAFAQPEAPPLSVPSLEDSQAGGIVLPDSSSTSGKHTPASVLKQSNAITRLVIPDLRLDAQVKYVPFQGNTWNVNDLGQSVAWLGTMNGDDTVRNLVLAGHVTVFDGSHGPFRYLSRLTPGAQLTVFSERYVYLYRVRELSLVEPEDAYITENTEDSQLTLITCALE